MTTMTTTTSKTDDDDELLLSGIPDFVREKLLEMRQHINEIESIYGELDKCSVKDLQAKLKPLDFARFTWINMYAINSLFFVYLKNNGISLKEHAIMTELGRMKSYLTRINEIAEKQENPDANKNKLRIDKQSSARIIKRSLWANATNKKARTSGGAKSQVSEMINATLDSVNPKRDLADQNNDDDNDDDDQDKTSKEDVHVVKRLKA